MASGFVLLVSYSLSHGAKDAIFSVTEIDLPGRLRHLTLEEVVREKDGMGGLEVVTSLRTGTYPDWRTLLVVWSMGKRPVQEILLPLPDDTLFYGFVPLADRPNSRGLLLVRTTQVELIRFKAAPEKDPIRLVVEDRVSRSIENGFSIPELGEAVPLKLNPPVQVAENRTQILIPVKGGVQEVRIKDKNLEFEKVHLVPPITYYDSSWNRQELELPYWARGSIWYRTPVVGSLNGSEKVLLWPWMDEVAVTPLSPKEEVRRISFDQLTEKERDDAQSYVVTVPTDLNNDGRTDFLVNKFRGAATALQAKTTFYLTDAKGNVEKKGRSIDPKGNRAGGALVVDLNLDGQKDFAVASAQFNVWTVVRALIRRDVKITFSIYMSHPEGYRLDKPDLERELSFKFDLSDLEIEGILPLVTGDFNGDGHPDVLYARDRERISILLFRPETSMFFSSAASGSFDVKIPRSLRIGDLTGDGRSDVILYDRRSAGNRKFTILRNTGAL